MKKLIVYLYFLIIFLNIFNINSCHIEFNQIDTSNIIRHVYERNVLNISGQLEYCPSSLIVRNISILNPILKRLSILNVSYLLERNHINITTLARLIGFAPLTIELYFENRKSFSKIELLNKNGTFEQLTCLKSLSNHKNILKNCPELKYENNYYILREKIEVAIKRHQTIIDILFTCVVIFLVTVGTLCIGCGLEIEQLMGNFRKPFPLIIGLFCQIIYLPLLSFLITKIFRLDNSTSLGLLSTASSPGRKKKNFFFILFILKLKIKIFELISGGGSSNIYTALLAGDVDLSVTMTFLSTICAFGTFPFWVWLLGKNYIDFTKTRFPWWSMILSLITLVIPAITGLLLRRYRPVLAHRIARYLNPIAVGYLVFILTFGGNKKKMKRLFIFLYSFKIFLFIFLKFI